MGFYAEVRHNYGVAMSDALKRWSSLNLKLAAHRNRRIFLLECKRRGLTPKHMSGNMNYLLNSASDAISSRQAQTMRERSLRLIIQFEITVTVTKITRMEDEQSGLWESLEGFLPQEMLSRFKHYQHNKYTRFFTTIKESNLRKVRALSDEQLHKLSPQDRWVRNISSTTIPDRVIKFLALGPKFSVDVPARKIPMSRLLSDIENIISLNDTLSEEGRNFKRAQATNVVTNCIKSGRGTNSIYHNEFFHCMKYLKQHPGLLVVRADKGNVTVLMDKTQYKELVDTLLQDEQYYKQLTRDPTTSMQNKCNAVIKSLVNKGYITQTQGKRLYNYNSVPARFHGLPKIHKPTLTIRPIISCINTPSSKLSVFISDILSKYLSASSSIYFIEDSFSFADLINDFQLPDNYVIISLDVISLFNNISLDLAVSAIESKWQLINNHTTIPKEEFLSIINFLFTSNYFVFDGIFYLQILGSPMGSNSSSPIADIVMDFILDNVLSDVPFHIPFIKKYVDDIICAVPEEQVNYLLEKFNNHHRRVQFTLEKETDRSVPFLDTKVIRLPDNRLILDWYRKPTSSGRYIHYLSNHTHGQKVNLVLGLKNRIRRIAHPSLRTQNLEILFQLMLENGYPRGLLNRLIHSSTHSGQPRNEHRGASTTIDLNLTYASLPLIKGMTNALISLLKTPNIKLIPKPEFKIDRLHSRIKDSVSTFHKSGVIYSVPCSMCNEIYIGQTSQQLKKRLAQHRSDIKNPNKICALADHSRDRDHLMDYEATRVLDCERNGGKRSFLEMYHIKRHPNAMNYRRDVNHISSIYSYLIHFDQVNEGDLSRPRSVSSDGVLSDGSRSGIG
ncbi:uncharacterized protein LOC123318931 [Coccinella septempunctata]|uniref:uncharacterized protein LOC123318931 n=1 Tax=Coccinella septempunctata TaxID=41139 RepID=UPI001D072504|nr:uncharacterized protein LOC123318931 [Coccinella septempunctata]